MWLSPYGCLQFSLALRIPIAKVPMNKLVFLQYLFSLAIVEACRDKAVLGIYGEAVKIKWPNDIYVVSGEGEHRELRKIGGVLVNTGIINEDSQIVIGRPWVTPVLYDMLCSMSRSRVWPERPLFTTNVFPSSTRPTGGTLGAQDGEGGSYDHDQARTSARSVDQRRRIV